MAEKIAKNIDVTNKKAGFEYSFLEKFTAGMVLTGTEIKSIRMNKFSMVDAYCFFDSSELLVRNLNISKYEQGTHYNHEPLRDRKLLLKKRELRRLENKLTDKGLTVVPIRLFINDGGLAKLEIALAKGKKLYDKRDTIKERDVARERMREE